LEKLTLGRIDHYQAWFSRPVVVADSVGLDGKPLHVTVIKSGDRMAVLRRPVGASIALLQSASGVADIV
jgi:hypothetical protein